MSKVNLKLSADNRKRAAIKQALFLNLNESPYTKESINAVKEIEKAFKVKMFVGLHGISAWTKLTPIVTWHAN